MKKILLLVLLSIFLACKKKDSDPKKEIELSLYAGNDSHLIVNLFNTFGNQLLLSDTLIAEGNGASRKHTFELLNDISILRVEYKVVRKTLKQGWGGWISLKINESYYLNEEATSLTTVKKEIDLSTSSPSD